MPTELPDGRVFVAYWFFAKEQEESNNNKEKVSNGKCAHTVRRT